MYEGMGAAMRQGHARPARFQIVCHRMRARVRAMIKKTSRPQDDSDENDDQDGDGEDPAPTAQAAPHAHISEAHAKGARHDAVAAQPHMTQQLTQQPCRHLSERQGVRHQHT